MTNNSHITNNASGHVPSKSNRDYLLSCLGALRSAYESLDSYIVSGAEDSKLEFMLDEIAGLYKNLHVLPELDDIREFLSSDLMP